MRTNMKLAIPLLLSTALQISTPATIGQAQARTPFNITAQNTNSLDLSQLSNLYIYGKGSAKFNAADINDKDLTFIYFGLPFANPSCNRAYGELKLFENLMEGQCDNLKEHINIICVFPYSKDSKKPLNNLVDFDRHGFTCLYGSVEQVKHLANNMDVQYSGYDDKYPSAHDQKLALFAGSDLQTTIPFKGAAYALNNMYKIIHDNPKLECQ